MLAQWVDAQGLRQSDEVNVGIAVTIEPEGLVVPVLRNAATRSLRVLAAELLDLVDKARAGRLSPAEMQGGTFSITNLGGYRVDGFTPILNPPQVAILGLHKIQDRPVTLSAQIVSRPMMYVALSYDHRIVDGMEAVQFLVRVKRLVEEPASLLLEG